MREFFAKIWLWLRKAFFGYTEPKPQYPFIDNTQDWERIELDILRMFNEYRLDNGMGFLTGDKGIREECEIRCDQMLNDTTTRGKMSEGLGHFIDDEMMEKSSRTLSHDGFPESSERLKEKGLISTGEIIAHNYSSAEAVVNAWKNSEGHNGLILTSRYTHCGIRTTVNSNTAKYFCVIFGR